MDDPVYAACKGCWGLHPVVAGLHERPCPTCGRTVGWTFSAGLGGPATPWRLSDSDLGFLRGLRIAGD